MRLSYCFVGQVGGGFLVMLYHASCIGLARIRLDLR